MASLPFPAVAGAKDFPIRAVGTSHCREAIAKIAPGTEELVFTTVALVPYETNSYDAQAVAVLSLVEPARLGHLPADLSALYRERAAEAGITGPAVCAVVISGGMAIGGEESNFAIQLDVELTRPLQIAEQSSYEAPIVKPRTQWIKQAPRELCVIQCWLYEPAERLLDRWNVTRWARPEWPDAGFDVHLVKPVSVAAIVAAARG